MSFWHQNLDEGKSLLEEYGLILSGVDMHIGSGGDMEHLKRITGKLVDLAKEFPDVETINFGGGLYDVAWMWFLNYFQLIKKIKK